LREARQEVRPVGLEREEVHDLRHRRTGGAQGVDRAGVQALRLGVLDFG
jgi:hypothetical protein